MDADELEDAMFPMLAVVSAILIEICVLCAGDAITRKRYQDLRLFLAMMLFLAVFCYACLSMMPGAATLLWCWRAAIPAGVVLLSIFGMFLFNSITIRK